MTYRSPDEDLVPAQVRNRILEMRPVTARELRANPNNFRQHGSMQRAALVGQLHEVGQTDVLKLHRSECAGGALTLINGHLRADLHPDMTWMAIITDLDDEEAAKDLLFGDTVTGMATIDTPALEALLVETPIASPSVRAALEDLLEDAKRADAHALGLPGPERPEHPMTLISIPAPPLLRTRWDERVKERDMEPHELLTALLDQDGEE